MLVNQGFWANDNFFKATNTSKVRIPLRAAEALVWGNTVPSAGLEPAHTAPEADALSTELRGQGARW